MEGKAKRKRRLAKIKAKEKRETRIKSNGNERRCVVGKTRRRGKKKETQGRHRRLPAPT